jgi:hypothetical protein
MEFVLYKQGILLKDMPEEGLRAGDVGTIIDRHDVKGIEPGYSVEFFDMVGNTVAVVCVAGSWLRSPTPNDRPTVRPETEPSRFPKWLTGEE